MFFNCISLDSFSISLEKLEVGWNMFEGCTNLSSFTSNLYSLIDGGSMFSCCERLSLFNANMENLKLAYYMFKDCSALRTFTSNLSSLKNGYDMFYGCSLNESSLSNIVNTINDISELNKNTDSDWTYQIGDETKVINSSERGYIDIGNNSTADIALELYEKGWDVYSSGTNVNPTIEHTCEVTKVNGYVPNAKEWNNKVFDDNKTMMANITKVENGYAWNGSTKLFKIRHQKLKNASYLFYQDYESQGGSYTLSNFVTWNADLPLLESGWYMFLGCKDLETFNGDLSSLKKANSMFNSCYNLSSFTTTNLDSLTEAEWMFSNCAITSFNTSLKSLQNAQSMFLTCSYLTSFSSDLSSLVCGSFMFRNCENLTSFYSTSLKSLLTGG